MSNRRIGLLFACLAAAGLACAQDSVRTIEAIAAMGAKQRENTLAAIRNSRYGDATLLELSTQAALKAEERRQAGQPPLFRGCLRADEFELGAQLGLARAAFDSKAYRALATEYRRLTTALRTALASARSSWQMAQALRPSRPLDRRLGTRQGSRHARIARTHPRRPGNPGLVEFFPRRKGVRKVAPDRGAEGL